MSQDLENFLAAFGNQKRPSTGVPLSMVTGKVVSVEGPNSCTIRMGSGTENDVPDVKSLSSYNPVAGDTVRLIGKFPDLFVLGKLGAGGGGGSSTDVQVFTSNGTWVKPEGAKTVQVMCVGQGGGGASGRKGTANSDRSGGGGGGGGSTVSITFVDPTLLPATAPVVLNTAGGGGPAQATNSTNGVLGTNGSTTTFSTSGTPSFVQAAGGQGGGTPFHNNANSYGGNGAILGYGGIASGAGSHAGVTANASTPTSSFGPTGGGAGGSYNATNLVRTPAPGGTNSLTMQPGGAAGVSSAGSPGPTAQLGVGGGGGAVGFAGGKGGFPGGGGGGGGAGIDSSANSGAGGNGGDGVVVVTTYF